jgi:Ca-activated chloride channel family protein
MHNEESFYDQLGLPRDATPEEVNHAYRELARRLHPDINLRPGDTELFLGVQKAYEVLSDPDQRKTYDDQLPSGTQFQSPLAVSVVYSRNSLVNLSEPQLIYVLLELSARITDHELPIPPLNLCLVLDCSTSMHGLRLDTVKLTAIEIIRQLRPEDILSIVSFSDKAQVIIPAGSRIHRLEIESRIQHLQASGGTEIYKGLEAGYYEIRRNQSKKHINHIILITDGRTYGDEENCLKLVNQANLDGIGISALGIGGQWNDTFLDKITSRTGGSSQFVSRTEDLRRFMLEKITKLGRSFAEQVTYNFHTTPDVEINYAFQLKPDPSPLETHSPLVLGAVPKDMKHSILLEFLVKKVPSKSSSHMLSKGILSFEIPSNNDQHKFAYRLNLSRSVTPEFDQVPPPSAIINAMSQMTLYRMQERARLSLKKGDIQAATQALQNLASHLLSEGHNELAQSVLNEVVHIQHTQTFSEEGEKRIKYGTRSLLQTTRKDDA